MRQAPSANRRCRYALPVTVTKLSARRIVRLYSSSSSTPKTTNGSETAAAPP
jgi:hypothetical protein